MVCDRCIGAVSRICADLAIPVRGISLGCIDAIDELSADAVVELRRKLEEQGFEAIDDPALAMVESIKNTVIHLVRGSMPLQRKLSVELSESLGVDYPVLSRLFSTYEKRTIENYFILQKVELVKELLTYGELTLSEIAYQCGYSSVAHLSRQFSQVTGMTPTKFKSTTSRIPLDKL